MRQILFVYNADSGLGNALVDAVHKLVSPGTYACSLCGITYGATRMRPEWKRFLQELPVPIRFLYRNQLPVRYPQLAHHRLPAIFAEAKDGHLHLVLSADELDRTDLPALVQVLRQRLMAENTGLEISSRPSDAFSFE